MSNDITASAYENKKTYGLCGLQNIGNSCYMNTIIQCMSNCQLFREFLTHKKFVEPLALNITKKFEKENKGKKMEMEKVYEEFNNTLTYQLFRVIKALWSANGCTLTIDTFKDLFGDKIKMFYGYAQHDTQEALNCLFMTIENEINVKDVFPIDEICPSVKQLMEKRDFYSKYIKEHDLSDKEKQAVFAEYEQYKKDNSLAVRGMDAYKSWKTYNKNNRNIIVDIFTGYYHVETTCPDCGFISDKFESFNCLPLTIVLKDEDGENEEEKKDEKNKHYNHYHHNKASQEVDIYDCLDEFCKIEKLDDENKWYCEKCKDKVNATRRFYIWKKPRVLIVLLKRFDYQKHFKTPNKVNFPLNAFDLSKHDSYLNKMEGEHKKYNLFAVSNHHGNMLGGHHFSYSKTKSGWYEFNDHKVKQICNFEKDNEDAVTKEIVTKSAYLLFYEQEE